MRPADMSSNDFTVHVHSVSCAVGGEYIIRGACEL